jgi:hypothetical protein
VKISVMMRQIVTIITVNKLNLSFVRLNT